VAQLSDRIVVMYRGQICEIGTAAQVSESPYHPYTRMLLASAADDEAAAEPAAGGTAAAPRAGCVFATRWPHKLGSICDTASPPLRAASESHAIACHIDAMPDAAILSALKGSDTQRRAGQEYSKGPARQKETCRTRVR
jgi:peptide/nickel transport system ATP-binding protein